MKPSSAKIKALCQPFECVYVTSSGKLVELWKTKEGESYKIIEVMDEYTFGIEFEGIVVKLNEF